MIVKVLGLSSFGECLERAAETINLWETRKQLRKLARGVARKYLETWPSVAAISIRRDDNNTQIVKVPRTRARARAA